MLFVGVAKSSQIESTKYSGLDNHLPKILLDKMNSDGLVRIADQDAEICR